MIDDFLRDFNRTVLEIDKQIVTAQRAISMEALNRVVMRTPVDSGMARANWTVAIDSPDTSTTSATDKDGQGAISSGNAVISGLTSLGVVYICNSLPYIEVLEYGQYPNPPKNPGYNGAGETKTKDGWSRQLMSEEGAARGMVAMTVDDLQSVDLETMIS